MALELHIWGPAFGLPSIEAQSLATVAYFVQCLPTTEWRLISSEPSSVGPTGELPALRVGSAWICGFCEIVTFLKGHSSGRWDLDQHLTPQQRADSLAFSSFLETRGQPLLDLSLYVSSENYTGWTRPALAQILRWPSQWAVPKKLREQAKVRSEHLGLSSLDIETVGKNEGETDARGPGSIPRHMTARRKETVASILGKSGVQNQFRLDAVTSDFLEPLCDMVKEKGSDSWLFGTDRASSLDCLLLGYLALMSPPLKPPHRWLQDALSSRYPPLLDWATNFRQECFGGAISAADVFAVPTSSSPRVLPWHPRAPTSIGVIGLNTLIATFDTLPIVSSYRSDRIIRASPRDAKSIDMEYSLYGRLGLVGGVLGASIGYCFYAGLLGLGKGGGGHQRRALPRRVNFSNQRDFGEAGRMLGLGST